jgi:hypothetical protein
MDHITAFICITFDKSTKVIDVKPSIINRLSSIFYPELNGTQSLYVSKPLMIHKNIQKFHFHACIEINLN